MTDSCSIDTQAPETHTAQGDDFAQGKHVLFFGDPMCSWCWGFAPELNQLAEQTQGRATLHTFMGGLRPGTTQPWDAQMRAYIRQHWQDVQSRTGQPFDFARFDDETFVYDTEPSARALVTVRTHAPGCALVMYEALQRAFYADNLDITDATVLARLAEACGMDKSLFLQDFDTPDMRQTVLNDYRRTREFGIQGFPAVVCAEDGQYAVLTLGYRPYSAMQSDFEAWLDA
ncbi:DsbA family protein [Magnetovibrio sp. PR-2]|uniref:DsbA family protein n=1 Tax=Magnetovibrio sp. PR-2 TaxID=3120356 RepID=UPI002FCDFAC5